MNFSDEMCAALRLADGALLVVDAVEGIMVNTERAVKQVGIWNGYLSSIWYLEGIMVDTKKAVKQVGIWIPFHGIRSEEGRGRGGRQRDHGQLE